jgi:hypothetical protein
MKSGWAKPSARQFVHAMKGMRMQETNNTINHNGEQVFFSVSPCSWMYKHYGLQVKISLKEHAVNAECEFILDKGIDATDKPKQELDDAAKVMVEKWLGENGTTLLHEHVAKWKAAKAKFDAEFAEEDARFAEQQKKDDKKHKAKGYTHRVDAWIHPTQGGDDYQTTTYFVGEPKKADIARLLRSSEVKNDYSVTAL